jgi:5-methylcytosine-specific restriction protein B
MARVANKKAQKALEAATTWRERCLENDGSVLGSEPLWTVANLTAVDDAVIRHPIDDPSRRYYDKLDEQLRGKAPAVAKLAAEVMWLLNLFPSRTRSSRKREDVGHIWALSGQPVPTDHPLLQDSVLGGIGHAGVAFNILRWRELDFAIQAFLAFKRLDRTERDDLLGDPWRFASWLDATPWSGKSGFRNILLYLLFPDSFEPIAIARHKRLILRHYAPEVGGPILTGKQLRELPLLELDRRVLDVRRYLERKYPGQPIGFYTRPVSDEFSPNVRRPRADRVIAPRIIDRNDATTVGPVVKLVDSRAAIQGLALEILGEA